jgi:hypothetical protein
MAASSAVPLRRRRSMRAARMAIAVAAAYLLLAYLIMPASWLLYERGRTDTAFLTTTVDGIPGDPINVALVGSRPEVMRAFAAAGWSPADPITLTSSLEIGLDVALGRPYADAPVSTLLFEGRRQDLAFEKPSGKSPDTRHHIRLWSAADRRGEPSLWYGAASFDRGVGVSHFTGEITHHIAPDIDAERDLIVADLAAAGHVASTTRIVGVGRRRNGVNGGGDRYFTDGMMLSAVLKGP